LVQLAGDALGGAAVGAAVDPAERKDMAALDAYGGPERVSRHPLGTGEIPCHQLAEVAADRIAVLVVPAEPLDQIVAVPQLVPVPAQLDPRLAQHGDEVLRRVAEIARDRL